MEKRKAIAIIKAIASSTIWGLGQFLNRQFLKGILFLSLFALFLGIEFYSGDYQGEFDLFDDKIFGDEAPQELSDGFITYYFYSSVPDDPFREYEEVEFLEFVASENGLTYSSDNHIFTSASGAQVQTENMELDILKLYEYLGQYIAEKELLVDIENDVIPLAETLALAEILDKVEDAIYEEAQKHVQLEENYDQLVDDTIEQLAIDYLIESGYTGAEANFDDLVTDHTTANYELLLIAAKNELYDAKYLEIYDEFYDQTNTTIMNVYYPNKFSKNFDEIYGAEMLQFDLLNAFNGYLNASINSGYNMSNDDYNKMLVHIYYAYNEDDYQTKIDQMDSFYYERAGFFVKGFWGVITMGTTPGRTIYQHSEVGYLLPSSTASETFEPMDIQLKGHHSTRLLLEGIISTLLILYFALIYYLNIRDAYKTSFIIYDTKKVPNEIKFFKDTYEKFFEYIVLTPAIFIITFISIMPILFGMLVAFTNFNINHIPPGQLIEWVGFDNFKKVFTLTSGEDTLPFGSQFWKVFLWTLIWAVSATFTCFFGGFIQAVILNNSRVVFRKAWRAILILPWAIPALVSQMMFRVMFQETGYVNSVLAKIGVNDLLVDWGMLGRSTLEAGDGIERLLYFGNQNIQWLTNEANPWFVRIFLIVLNVWLGFPFFMALMSGVMTSIDKSLYEAASIDGATPFQQFKYITMPLVLFATSPLLVMTFSGNFNNFGVIYFITGGGPGGSSETAFAGDTDILISWIYKLTTDASIRWYSMASVFSILIFLLVGTMSAWNFTRTRAFREDD